MIIFLYGKDAYRIKQKAKELAKKHAKDGTGTSYLNLEENEDYLKLEEKIKVTGLFSDKEILVIRNGFLHKKLLDLLKQYDVDKDKDRLLIITESSNQAELKKKNKDLFEYLASKAIATEIEPLDGTRLNSWVIKEALNMGLIIDRYVAQKLIDSLTNQDKNKMAKDTKPDRTWHIATELAKIANSKHNNKDKKATIEDIENLVIPIINPNIFAFTDAVASRKRGVATKMLYSQLEKGMDPYYLHSMLVYQFRNMLKIKSMMAEGIAQPGIINKTRLHPFVIQKTSTQVRNFDLNDLKKHFCKLQELELNSKNGMIDLKDGLYQFIFSING
ncbi:MAG: DNA polymerase III subunit delta [Parcubacteria group bacterium]